MQNTPFGSAVLLFFTPNVDLYPKLYTETPKIPKQNPISQKKKKQNKKPPRQVLKHSRVLKY